MKKTNRIFSRLDAVPRGNAGYNTVRGCLILEGGAFRGLYTQGFLDALMQQSINLECVVGVSAGALSGMYYISGQIGNAARINLTYRHDSRYLGMKALLHSRSIVDVGFLTENRGIFEPMDMKRFNYPGQRFLAVATNCLTGKAEYFEKGKCGDIFLAVRASATMPFVSPAVMIDGVPYLDGGCACKIPYQWALDQGFEKILVLRTREAAFRKPEKVSSASLRFYGRRYPEFARALSMSSIDYNRQCAEIEQLHAQGRLMRLAPSQPVGISRLERDVEKLGALYELGYRDARAQLPAIQDYLGLPRIPQHPASCPA